VSAKFPVPLTPAGWAFSIWGLIFLLEGFGAVYHALEAGYDADGFKARFANATNDNWIVSWLAAMGWQFAFVQQVRGAARWAWVVGMPRWGAVAPGSPPQHWLNACPPLFCTSSCTTQSADAWRHVAGLCPDPHRFSGDGPRPGPAVQVRDSTYLQLCCVTFLTNLPVAAPAVVLWCLPASLPAFSPACLLACRHATAAPDCVAAAATIS